MGIKQINPFTGKSVKQTKPATQIMKPWMNKSVWEIPQQIVNAWVEALTREGKNPSMRSPALQMSIQARRFKDK